jgi:hypothetical protein
MAAPILLRSDFDGPALRALALSKKAGNVTRRLLALVTVYDGSHGLFHLTQLVHFHAAIWHNLSPSLIICQRRRCGLTGLCLSRPSSERVRASR